MCSSRGPRGVGSTAVTRVRRIVIAPDSFKGTIGARQAAEALAEGWSAVRPRDELRLRPMADGGEGTLDAFESAVAGAVRVPIAVTGPGGRRVEACWLRLPATDEEPETAIVELASTSGIELLGRDGLVPMDAGTRGFGEAIRAALEAGIPRLVLAIGSSASSDGGAGLLQALGARILDSVGAPIDPGARGLLAAARLDVSRLAPLPPEGVVVLADVVSPLLGHEGAAAVFAPQKGATPDEVEAIERALTRWAGLVGLDPAIPGSGAAGGAGYGLLAWGARLEPGAATVAGLVGLAAALDDADLVVTGEGSFDAQSARGKAPGAVMDAARAADVPVAVVAGRVRAHPDLAHTLDLSELAGGVAEAMARPGHWLRQAGSRLAASAFPSD